jgi:GNAT superfamily N-acetyltransferase
VPDIAKLVRRAITETNSRDYTPAQIGQLLGEHDAPQILRDLERRHVLVAEQGGVVLGTAGIDRRRIRMVFVEPEAQGRGIGKRLMNHLIAYAEIAGLEHLLVHASLTAEGFYARFGFTPLDEQPVGRVPVRRMYLGLRD